MSSPDQVLAKLSEIVRKHGYSGEIILSSLYQHGHVDLTSAAYDDDIVSEIYHDNPPLRGKKLKQSVAFLGIHGVLESTLAGGKKQYWLDPIKLLSDKFEERDVEKIVVEWLNSHDFKVEYWHQGKKSNESYDIIAKKDGRRYYIDAKQREGDRNFLRNIERPDSDKVAYAIIDSKNQVFLAVYDKSNAPG